MQLPSRPLSLALGIAAYAAGTAVAGLITVQAVQHFGIAVLERFGPSADAHGRRPAEKPAPRAANATAIVRREAAMTLLSDKGSTQSRPAFRLAAGPEFGASSRSSSRWPGPYRERPWGFDEDDDDRPRESATFRTLCVRLCDGYYFPVSFAVMPNRLQRDSNVCQSRCGAQGRLYVYRNPGGAVEDMQDLNGRPYRQLPTAFLYRSEYVPSCKCQAQPWETASQDRHRLYALAADARKGNKDAAKELLALRARLSQVAEAPDQPAPVPKDADPARRIDEDRMGLGNRSEQRPQRAVPRADPMPDWVRRAFGGG